MQARRVDARQGWQWVREGFSLFARAPVPLIPMSLLMLFTLVLLAAPPVVGAGLSLLASPGLMYGFVQGVRAVAEGHPTAPWTLYSGFRKDTGPSAGTPARLLGLGLFNIVFSLLAVIAANLIDDGATSRMLQDGPNASVPQLDARPLWAAFAFLVIYVPAQTALWFAPLFAAWHATPAAQALFYSFVACWRNRRAFIVYGLGWSGVALAVSVVAQLVISTLSGLAVLVVAPLMLVVVTAMYASIWPAYRDIFAPEPDEAAAPAS